MPLDEASDASAPSDSFSSFDPPDPGDPTSGRPRQITPERVRRILDENKVKPPLVMRILSAGAASETTTNRFAGVVASSLEPAESFLRSRPMAPEEVEAFVLHHAMLLSRFASIKAISPALPLFLAWRTRRTFGFPFYKPKWVRATPDAWPLLRFTLARGPAARYLWHASRFAAYGFFTFMFIQMPLNSWAITSMKLGVTLDPRLERYQNDVATKEENIQAIEERRREIGLPRSRPGPRRGPLARPSPVTSSSDDDQASRDDKWGQGNASSATSSASPSPSGIGGGRVVQQNSVPPAPAHEPSRSSAWDDDWIADEDDDASPVAPSHKPPPPREKESGSPGSAWERLRERAIASSQDDPGKRNN